MDTDSSTIPQPESKFTLESLSSSLILHSLNSEDKFLDKSLKFFTSVSVCAIEINTRGQSENPNWIQFRRHVITASIAHDKNKIFNSNEGH